MDHNYSTPRPRRTRGDLVAKLRHRIVRGELSPGARLPTRTQLVSGLGASSGTIQAAVDCLIADGFLETGPTGTFVTRNPPHLCDLTVLFAHDPSPTWQRFDYALYEEAKRFASTSGRRVEFRVNLDVHGSRDFFRFESDLKAHRLAGVIHTNPPFPHIAELLKRHRDIPRVAIMSASPDLDIPSVSVDFQAFFNIAAEQLRKAGRTRIALIAPLLHDPTLNKFNDALRVNRLTTQTWWQHAPTIHPTHGDGIRNVVHAMMRLPVEDRPDGLIISDDHQIGDATAGIVASGVRVPEDLTIVAHTNFPHPAKAHVPVIRIGFDTAHVFQTCVDLIDRQRRSRTVPHFTVIPAISDAPEILRT